MGEHSAQFQSQVSAGTFVKTCRKRYNGGSSDVNKICNLLICLDVVNYPSCDVPALWIMVRPMYDAAFLIPDILAVKANAVASLESFDSRGNADVVCHQQCLSRLKLNNESLVSQPIYIVRQNASHSAFALHLYVACSTRECATNGVVV